MKVLTGDIGGTKTRLCIVELKDGRPRISESRKFRSRDFDTFAAVLDAYLAKSDSTVDYACFGVAGPVIDGRCATTNLPWVLDADSIGSVYGWPHVGLLNDLEAVAWGVPVLGPEDLFILNAGKPAADGNAAVIAAGTGLGQAGLCWNGQGYIPFASEGGHTDFAPVNETETAFASWLADRHGHVSWERAVSGMGLVNIYEFLLEHRSATRPEWLEEEMRSFDSAASISAAAMTNRDAVCREALDMFVRFLGTEAGNLALKMMATAGVYIAGGIPPKVLERLKQEDFMQAFYTKGRMTTLMQSMPVSVVLNTDVSLFGAAFYMHSTHAAVEDRGS